MKKVMRIALPALLTGSLFLSCNKLPIHFPSGGGSGGGGNTNVSEAVYFEANNAVMAYKNNGDGQLQVIGSYATGGSIVFNPTLAKGPNISDNEVIVSQNGKFLLVTNSGTNTITVFSINGDGSLTPVPGSPFPSGGLTPVSLAQWKNYIFVVNKSNDPLNPSTVKPNYTTFILNANGSLTPVPGATLETTAGGSPIMALVSHNKQLLFGADYLASTLRSFIVSDSGTLTPAAGSPQAIPVGGGVYGLCEHPLYNNLYVGFPAVDKVGVYDINAATGALTYKTALATGGAGNMRPNKAGNRLYVLDPINNTVVVVNISDPASPVVMSQLQLKNSGAGNQGPNGIIYASSSCVSLGLSSNEKFLYVLSRGVVQSANSYTNSWFHVLQVQADGTVTETGDPIFLNVSFLSEPCGVTVHALN